MILNNAKNKQTNKNDLLNGVKPSSLNGSKRVTSHFELYNIFKVLFYIIVLFPRVYGDKI